MNWRKPLPRNLPNWEVMRVIWGEAVEFEPEWAKPAAEGESK